MNRLLYEMVFLFTVLVTLPWLFMIELRLRPENNYLNKLRVVIAMWVFIPNMCLCFNGVQSEVRHAHALRILHHETNPAAPAR
jgi:hypothetical protein